MNNYYEMVILGTLLNNSFNNKYLLLIKKFSFKNIFCNIIYFIGININYNFIFSINSIINFLIIRYFNNISIDFLFINNILSYCLCYNDLVNLINIINYYYLIKDFKNKTNVYFSNLSYFLCKGYKFLIILFNQYIQSLINNSLRLNNNLGNKFNCLKKMLLTTLGFKSLIIAKTGILELDYYINGLTIGDLIIIAGRPSIGKTTFSINISCHLFINLNIPVLYFSLEMTMFQILLKLLIIINNNSDIKNQLNKTIAEKRKFLLSCLLLRDSKIEIIDSNISNLFSLEMYIKNWIKINNSIGVVFIDYLQLLCFNSYLNRSVEISLVSRRLKIIAKKYGIVIIALSQMNRNIEQSINRFPILSDLRDSGSIEQDADIIIFLHKNLFINNKILNYLVIDLIIAKNRNGIIGSTKIYYNTSSTRFCSKSFLSNV